MLFLDKSRKDLFFYLFLNVPHASTERSRGESEKNWLSLGSTRYDSIKGIQTRVVSMHHALYIVSLTVANHPMNLQNTRVQNTGLYNQHL